MKKYSFLFENLKPNPESQTSLKKQRRLGKKIFHREENRLRRLIKGNNPNLYIQNGNGSRDYDRRHIDELIQNAEEKERRASELSRVASEKLKLRKKV